LKITILGANGLLGNHIQEEFRGYDIEPLTRQQCDITNPSHINQINSDVVINCAAYTNVDKAETDSSNAYNLNADCLFALSNRVNKLNALLIHISTDFVFDGDKSGYTPNDLVNPLSVYGRSKWFGELYVQTQCKNYRIVRVQSLYGDKGINFASKLVSLLLNKQSLKLDNKRLIQPTYGKFVANGLKNLIDENNGIYHLASNGQTTWYEFGKRISEILELKSNLEPVSNFKYIATRPTHSIFSYTEGQDTWEVQLDNYLYNKGLL
jgi:dTDP-4-dehydrorhamnose reductase